MSASLPFSVTTTVSENDAPPTPWEENAWLDRQDHAWLQGSPVGNFDEWRFMVFET